MTATNYAELLKYVHRAGGDHALANPVPHDVLHRYSAIYAWAACETAILALQREIERLQADGIHSCHDECPRIACVLRREIAELKKQAAVNPTTPYGPPTINFRQTGVRLTVSEWYSVSEAEPMRLLAIAKDGLEIPMLLTPGYTNEDLARHITTGLAAIDAAMREGKP